MLRRGPSVAVPFVGGLDTKADSKMTPMGSFQVLENAVFTEHGSLKKRWGYDVKLPVATDGSKLTSYLDGTQLLSVATATAVSSWNETLMLQTQRDLFAWSGVSSKWVSHGSCESISVGTESVPQVVGEQTMGDTISNGVITAHIWEDSRDSGSVRASVVDANNGFVYVHDYQLDVSGSIPRCAISGGRIILVWVNSAASTVKTVSLSDFDPAGSIAATAETVASSLSAADTYDVISSEGKVWMACITTELEIHEINSLGVSIRNESRDVATEFTLTAANLVHLSVAHVYTADLDPDDMPIGPGFKAVHVVSTLVDGTDGFWVRHDETNLSVLAGQVFTTTTAGTINNLSLVQQYGDSSTTSFIPVVAVEIDGGDQWDDLVSFELANSSFISMVRHAGLASRGAVIGDVGHVVLNHTSPALQNSYFLYNWADSKPVARFGYGNASSGYNKGQLPSLYSSDGVNFTFAGLMSRRISSLGQAFEPGNSDAATFDNSRLSKFTFSYGGAAESIQLGQTAYIAKGMLMAFSGVGVEESAPLLYPEDVTIADDTPGTHSDNLVSGSTYLYRVYYERYRANGENVRSLAFTFLHTVGGSDTNTELTLPTLSHTRANGDGDWRITVYRTEANKTDLFYLCTSPDLTVTSGPNNYVANVTSASTITFLDDMLDSVLIKNDIDAQSQGVLPVVQPAPATVLGEAGNRLFLAGGEYDAGVIAPSLLHFPGEPVLFSDDLRFSLEEEGGVVTAMGAIDGVLVAFKERRVYAVSGDGPDDTGSGLPFSIQRVTTDVGCTSPGSVVEVPDGLMFQSAKGLYMIDRSFNTQYIGWPVEIFNEQSMVSAEVVPNTNSVIFLTSEGQSLSYDYFFKQWSTWTGHAGVSAVVVGGEYHYLRSDSEVYTRNEGAFLDAGQWYAMRLRTAPIRLESVQDYMRVHRVNILGEYLSSHRLQMKVYNNRDISPFEIKIFEPDSVIDLTLWGDADTESWGAYQAFGTTTTPSGSLFEAIPAGTTTLGVLTTAGWPASGIVRLSDSFNGQADESIAYASIDAANIYLSSPTTVSYDKLTTFFFDEQGTATGTEDTELWGGVAGDTDYQFQHKFKRQKVQYLRLEFKDLQSGAAPGQSYELAEMNFDIGVYDRNARIPARRKI